MKTILDISIAVILIISGGCKTSNGNSESESTSVNKSETVIESKISNSSDESKNESATDDDTKKVISEPIHLTKELFLEKVMNYEKNTEEWVFEGDLPCIIDFYADWCRPCKITSPILDELAKEYAGKIHVYKIDTEKERELAGVFGIRSIPTFLYCPKEGKPQMTSGIARTNEETKRMFRQNIDEILLSE